MRRNMLRMLSNVFASQPEEVDVRVVRNLVGGMNTEMPPEDIADNEFVDIHNWEIRKGCLQRRRGFTQYLTAPDARKILGLFTVKRFNGNIELLRFTRDSIYKSTNGAAFIAVTGAALTGSDDDYWTVVTVEDRIFASNGVNKLIELDLTLNTYANAGATVQAYKYYVVANRRIVGANRVTSTASPIEIASSGNRNYGVWDPATDISAWTNQMVDSEQATSDEITGLQAIGDSLIILRERSIWIGEPQPIAAAPFNLRKVVSGIGCTSPGSVKKVGDDKIMWIDPATKGAYLFTLNINGYDLKRVGDKVTERLYVDVSSPASCRATYNPEDREYEVLLQDTEGTNPIVWKYCLHYNAWHRHTISGTSLLEYVYIPSTSISISALGSTPIEELIGTIRGLSDTVDNDSIRIIGKTNGVIALESNAVGDVGTLFFSQLTFKYFDYEARKQNVLGMILDVNPFASVIYNLSFWEDDETVTPAKTFTKTASTRIPLVFKHNVLCNQFHAELTIGGILTFVATDILGYTLKRTPAGEY